MSLRGGIAAVAISCTRLCPRDADKGCIRPRRFKDYGVAVADSFHREVATARMGLAKTYSVRALHDKLQFAARDGNLNLHFVTGTAIMKKRR